MNSKPESENLLVKLAKAKAAAQAKDKRFGTAGKEISKRFAVERAGNQSYTWRGGRNGQGKP